MTSIICSNNREPLEENFMELMVREPEVLYLLVNKTKTLIEKQKIQTEENVLFDIAEFKVHKAQKKLEISQTTLEKAQLELYKTFAPYIRKYKNEFTELLDEEALVNLIKYF
ncbi:hypothetical protein [Lactococcus kimchii]|uniref:hypothetical protein n=1 Tax=Lactococcus sp. S-13 TaxID=2507158 RepID=UPI001023920C|nr:hypothetical protein [Lactococcus sp. S-13]RZI47947.1 hypothetical protein EQJ87_11075 [Lactococcus sp. S-13]